MKKCLIITAVLCAVSAFALEPYDFWTFENDAVGAAFGANWENSGSQGSQWNYGGPPTLGADGAGSMVVSNHPGQTFRKLPGKGTVNADPSLDQYAEPFTSGVYRLELDFSSWELDSTATNSSMRLNAVSENNGAVIADIRLSVLNGTHANLRLGTDLTGTSGGYRIFEYSLTNDTAVSAAIEFDFDTDTVTYHVNGSQTHSFTDFEGIQLGQVLFVTDSLWSSNSTVFIEQMGLLGPDLVPLQYMVEFDSATQVTNSSANKIDNFVLDTGAPVVVADGTNYIGADVYGAMHERNIGLWSVSDDAGSGLKVRMNNSLSNGVDGVFLFKTDAVGFQAGSDALDAAEIFIPQIQRMSSATLRFVVEDAGQFYISESSPEYVTGGSGGVSVSHSVHALEINWFNYDPVSHATNISVIGTSATPAFADIDFIGFALFADGVTSAAVAGGVNFGVREFSAQAVTGVPPTDTPTSQWEDWLGAYSVGAETGMLDHADSDGLDNLTEYAWGGNPAESAVLGNTPIRSQVIDSGTNYIEYVYFERDDAGDRGLESLLQVGADLVATNWMDGSMYKVNSGASGVAGYNAVTNRIPMDSEKKFIRLQIEFSP